MVIDTYYYDMAMYELMCLCVYSCLYVYIHKHPCREQSSGCDQLQGASMDRAVTRAA